jgi:hypothetical protein
MFEGQDNMQRRYQVSHSIDCWADCRWLWARERSCGGPWASTIVGGLLLSQLLTLYTTLVVYLWFDRLAQRFARHRIGNPIPQEGMTD